MIQQMLLTKKVTAPSGGLNDGDTVITWPDSSASHNDALHVGTPIFKTNIVNGKPVVRFTSAASAGFNLTTPISGNWPFIIYAVMKANNAGVTQFSLAGNATAQLPLGPLENSDGFTYIADRNGYQQKAATYSAAWHVLTAYAPSSGTCSLAVDNTVIATNPIASATSGNFITLGAGPPGFSNGDIAEILFYQNAGITAPQNANICAYLGAKYGITIAGGGIVIDPSTVTGLVGWWKADSL